MNYEIVELNEKTVVGLTSRTNNYDENMTKIINDLWTRFLYKGVHTSILNKLNNCRIGLYSNYESDFKGSYDVTVCCEVDKCDKLPACAEVKTIPSGKYAKFVIRGEIQSVITEFWTKLWSMDLNRQYSYDFEEYQSGGNQKNCEIHIYISIN